MKISHILFLQIIAITLVIVLGVYFASLKIEQTALSEVAGGKLHNLENEFNVYLSEEIGILTSVNQLIMSNDSLMGGLIERNREKLMEQVLPLFNELKDGGKISRMYFILPDGEVFFRPYEPKEFGDVLTRQSFLNAQISSSTSSGIEVGKNDFSLRVISPYYSKNNLEGYVESAIDVDTLLASISEKHADVYALFVPKAKLNKERYLEYLSESGRADNWDDYGEYVLISREEDNFISSNCFTQDTVFGVKASKHFTKLISDQTEHYSCGGFVLLDNSKEEVAVALVTTNISSEAHVFENMRQNIVYILGALLVIAILLSIISSQFISRQLLKLTKRVDEITRGKLEVDLEKSNIAEVQSLTDSLNRILASLKLAILRADLSKEDIGLGEAIDAKKKAEAKAQKYLDLTGSIIVALDKAGCITLLNKKGYEILGYEYGSLEGKNWFEISLPKSERANVSKVFSQLMSVNSEGPDENEDVDGSVLTKSGKIRLVKWHNSIIRDEFGNKIGTLSSGEDITDIRAAEASAKESQSFFKLISENAADMIAIVDLLPSFKHVYASPSYSILGYTPEEIIGKPALYYAHPDDKGKLMKIAEEYIKSKVEFWKSDAIKPIMVSGRFKAKDGSWHVLDMRATLTKDYIVIVSRDVTEKLKLETKLEESHRFLQSILDGVNIPMFYKNTKGEYIGCNKSYEEVVMGLKNEYIIGKTAHQLFKKEYADMYVALDSNLINNPSKGSESIEVVMYFASDKKFHEVLLSKALFYDAEGKIGGIVGSVTDLKKVKSVQMTAKASENKFNELFENAVDPIFILNSKGSIIEANHKCTLLLGYKKSELIGKNIFTSSIIDTKSRAIVVANFKKRLAGAEIRPYMIDLIKKSGKKVKVELNASLMKDSRGASAGIMVIAREVTWKFKNAE